jgi:hypothetical protein
MLHNFIMTEKLRGTNPIKPNQRPSNIRALSYVLQIDDLEHCIYPLDKARFFSMIKV